MFNFYQQQFVTFTFLVFSNSCSAVTNKASPRDPLFNTYTASKPSMQVCEDVNPQDLSTCYYVDVFPDGQTSIFLATEKTPPIKTINFAKSPGISGCKFYSIFRRQGDGSYCVPDSYRVAMTPS